jgi:hypothetical protein
MVRPLVSRGQPTVGVSTACGSGVGLIMPLCKDLHVTDFRTILRISYPGLILALQRQ